MTPQEKQQQVELALAIDEAKELSRVKYIVEEHGYIFQSMKPKHFYYDDLILKVGQRIAANPNTVYVGKLIIHQGANGNDEIHIMLDGSTKLSPYLHYLSAVDFNDVYLIFDEISSDEEAADLFIVFEGYEVKVGQA